MLLFFFCKIDFIFIFIYANKLVTVGHIRSICTKDVEDFTALSESDRNQIITNSNKEKVELLSVLFLIVLLWGVNINLTPCFALHSWLTGQEPDVVSCYCSLSTSRFDGLRCFSARHDWKE